MWQHVVKNDAHDMDFAGYPRGIKACSPHDTMQASLEGVL
jgi:hypothetical protein